ncbi:hypothetical protein [uncultured Jannaschia sp.]|uniref:hypothetical protein n=1 Tax=Jannaschia halovivens TaxID=3388667 RepID=UPI0026329FF7|nr:hypothetical protein [uncultured Jannaschia sp.]
MLQQSEAVRQAHRLYDLMGDRSEAHAAERARSERDAGDREAARGWEMIRRVIRMRRGPNES